MKKEILKRYRKLILLIEIIIVVAFSLISYHYFLKPEGKKTFYLLSHNTESLYQSLEDNNYSMYFFDKLYLPFVEIPQEGWYHIESFDQGRFTFLDTLHKHKASTHKIIIYAGETAKEITKRLAKNLHLNAIRLLVNYRKLTRFGEGDLIAGEYSIANKSNEKDTMQYLFYQSGKIKREIQAKYTSKPINALESKIVLTIASIIQKESNYAGEMPLISSVIYNRLEKNMRLQMDSTLNYGRYSHKVINPERIKTDTSEYNTYKYKGLPPKPLCSISKEAYEAAYLPQTTNYFFFMLDRNGTHLFANSYKEHLVNVRKFKSKTVDSNSSNSTNSTTSKNILISSAR